MVNKNLVNETTKITTVVSTNLEKEFSDYCDLYEMNKSTIIRLLMVIAIREDILSNISKGDINGNN